MKSIYFIWFIIILLVGCKKDNPPPDNLPYQPTPYTLEIPKGFPPMAQPDFNPLTVEGVELGRRLYYDTILSTNGNACASCHVQTSSFSAAMGPGGFSVPPHVNLGWNPDFAWNGGEPILDHVAIIDLEVPEFLAPDMDILYQRLQNHQEYQDMFKKAYGIDILAVSLDDRKHYISYALGQFLRILISGNSKYDRVMQGKEFFTDSELRGFEIFFSEQGDCFHCHGTALFTDNQFHNTGLDDVFVGRDQGRYLVTNDPNDMGKWSSPTLRNIELTAPYMHDGRLKTLEEVVEFYNSGVKKSPTLDPLMTKAGKENGLNLTAQDKADLVNFMKTLTDTSFIFNKKYSNPFK